MNKKVKHDYIDDLELTKLLTKECRNRKMISENNEKNGIEDKLPGPSEQLGEWFVKVTNRMLTRGNFRGYSDNYKDEFISNSYLFFARYWWKFDALRSAGNYISIKDEKGEILRELRPEEEWKGGFSYFTTLAWTGTLGALKSLKESDSYKKKLAESLTNDSKIDTTTEYYLDRSFHEGGY